VLQTPAFHQGKRAIESFAKGNQESLAAPFAHIPEKYKFYSEELKGFAKTPVQLVCGLR
jgi:hypothetical protein